MKSYDITMEVSVSHVEGYNSVTPLKFRITEKLPANMDAKKYIRARLAEETDRAFASLTPPLDNFESEEKKGDPLQESQQ